MKPNIGILESIHPEGIKLLKTIGKVYLDVNLDKSKLYKKIQNYDVVIIKSNIQINEKFINCAKRLKIVARAGTGVDNINLEYLKKKKIKFFSTPKSASISVSELTISLILSLVKKLPDINHAVKKNDYRRHLFLSNNLSNLSVGLVGIGNAGIEVAKRLQAFGCKIYGFDNYSKYKTRFKKYNGIFVKSLKTILSLSDIISFHVRLNKSTEHLLNLKNIKFLKKNSIIINTSRAKIIEEKSIIVGLKKKIISKVGLDVLYPEMPYEKNPDKNNYFHKFLNNKNIYITPHIGSMTDMTQKKIALELISKIKRNLVKKNIIRLKIKELLHIHKKRKK